MLLKNKVAVITGGASGIGESGTRRFADEGAAVVMLDVNENAGNALEKELCEKGQKVWFIKTDISDESSVKSAFDKITEKAVSCSVLSSVILPRCSSTILRTTDRPTPAPSEECELSP